MYILFFLECHLNVICMVASQYVSFQFLKCQWMCDIFLHKSHYMSNSKVCVLINVHFYLCANFCMSKVKNCKKKKLCQKYTLLPDVQCGSKAMTSAQGIFLGHNLSRSQSSQLPPVTSWYLGIYLNFFIKIEVYSFGFYITIGKFSRSLQLQPGYSSNSTGSSLTKLAVGSPHSIVITLQSRHTSFRELKQFHIGVVYV